MKNSKVSPLLIPVFDFQDGLRPSILKFMGRPLHLQIFHLLSNSMTASGDPVYWDKRVISVLLQTSKEKIHSFFNRLRQLSSSPYLGKIYESSPVPAQSSYLFTNVDGNVVGVDNHPRTKVVKGYRLLKNQFKFEFNARCREPYGLLLVNSSVNFQGLSLIASLLSFLSNPALQKILSCFSSLEETLSVSEIEENLSESEIIFRRRTFYESIRSVNNEFPPQLAPLSISLSQESSRPRYLISPNYFGISLKFEQDLDSFIGVDKYRGIYYVSKLHI